MRSTTYLLITTCLTAALFLSGCGGAASLLDDLAGTRSETIEVVSEPTLDGRVATSGFLSFSPSTSVAFTGDMGDTYAPTYRSRQIFAFSMAALPAGARITSATLRVHQSHSFGTPYPKLGNVVVDLVDYVGDPGPQTYDEQTLVRNIGTISTSPALGLRTLDVTGSVESVLVAGSAWSQFRLRFYTPGFSIVDDINDYVRFADAEDSFDTHNPPTLIIEYEH